MLTHPTHDRLIALGLTGMAKALEDQRRQPDIAALAFEERIAMMIDREAIERENKRLTTRLKFACLRQSAVVEDVDMKAPRGLDKALFHKLAAGDWIDRHQNLIVIGPTGVGKSWLACALGHKACRDDRSVFYQRVPRLFDALALARGDGRHARLLKTLARVELLILDDWGLATLTHEQGRDLLEIVDDRHNRGSTIVTSQLPVDHWHEAIANPTVADAILDRLVHNAHRLTLERRQHAQSGRQNASGLDASPAAVTPLPPSTGAPCPRSSECCPQSIGTLSAFNLNASTSPPKERYAVSKDNIIKLIQPGNVEDQLTEILRNGARALLAQAVDAEVADFLGKHADLKTADGHQRVVRHGHLPEREVMTGIGAVAVRQPRVRDREADAADPGRIRFSPSILPPYMRRSKSIETLLPILYLKGISTGDFSEALAALLGKDAAGLSASAIGRLKDGWFAEHTAWQKRDLSAKRYVYIWADGIHLQARLEDEKQCILVLIGATPEGRKELVGFTDGARESAQDWRDLLLDLKRRGLDVPPRLAIADGALGFWKAAGEVWPKTPEQRCWVHKTANVIAKLPKSQQPKAKRALQEIWMAETKAAAELAFDAFIESYTPKYAKAADCLSKDRDTLLAFFDFPAEHWKHLRTTNPIESTFATVRHRTIRSKGCLSNRTALAMVFKLLEAAQKSWRRLDGHNQLPKLVLGVTFNDGIEVIAKPTDRQPITAAA